MLVLSGRLPLEVGALLVKALQIAAENTTEQTDAEPSQNLADALGEVAAAALGEGLAHRAGKQRTADYQVLVHVDQNVLQDPEQEGRSETEGAVSVSAETARRLTCDQPVLNITDAENACHHHPDTPCPLNQGRSTRRPGYGPEIGAFNLLRRRIPSAERRRSSSPYLKVRLRRPSLLPLGLHRLVTVDAPISGPALQRAVRTRDQGTCQFPGCTHRHHLHLHHIKHWAPEITPWTPTPTWDGTYPVDYQAAVDWLQHLDSAS